MLSIIVTTLFSLLYAQDMAAIDELYKRLNISEDSLSAEEKQIKYEVERTIRTEQELEGVARSLSFSDVEFKILQDEEYKRLRDFALDTLAAKRRSSFAITGPKGVGKTTMLYTLAAELQLNGHHPVVFSAADFGNDTKFAGQIEEKFKKLFDLVRHNKNVVLLMDDMHTVKGLGTSATKMNDFFDQIAPELSSGRMKIIGTTTSYEFEKNFKRAGAGAFREFRVQEPKAEVLENRLYSWLDAHYDKKAREYIEKDMLRKVIATAEKYSAELSQPSKTISYLEPLLNEAIKNKRPITDKDIKEVVGRENQLESYFTYPYEMEEKLKGLRVALDESVIGQAGLKEKIEDAAYLALSGTKNADLPKMMMIIAGLKGQAKTAIVQAYADYMGLGIKRFNMAAYSTYNDIDIFKSELASHLEMHPYSVILFDEIEKAGTHIQRVLLDFSDSGRFNITYKNHITGDVITKEVDARKAHVFGTANAGSQAISAMLDNKSVGFIESEAADLSFLEKRESLHEVLRAGGIEEFVLDRYEAVFVKPLHKGQVRSLAVRVIEDVIRFVESSKKVVVEMSKESIDRLSDHITEKNFSETMSNRTILSTVESMLTVKLARKLIREPEALSVSFEDDRVFVEEMAGTCRTLF